MCQTNMDFPENLLPQGLHLKVMYQEAQLILLCQHPGQVSVLQCSGLEGWLALSTNNMCLASLDFLENFFSQWLHWALEKGRSLVWQVT